MTLCYLVSSNVVCVCLMSQSNMHWCAFNMSILKNIEIFSNLNTSKVLKRIAQSTDRLLYFSLYLYTHLTDFWMQFYSGSHFIFPFHKIRSALKFERLTVHVTHVSWHLNNTLINIMTFLFLTNLNPSHYIHYW